MCHLIYTTIHVIHERYTFLRTLPENIVGCISTYRIAGLHRCSYAKFILCFSVGSRFVECFLTVFALGLMPDSTNGHFSFRLFIFHSFAIPSFSPHRTALVLHVWGKLLSFDTTFQFQLNFAPAFCHENNKILLKSHSPYRTLRFMFRLNYVDNERFFNRISHSKTTCSTNWNATSNRHPHMTPFRIGPFESKPTRFACTHHTVSAHRNELISNVWKTLSAESDQLAAAWSNSDARIIKTHDRCAFAWSAYRSRWFNANRVQCVVACVCVCVCACEWCASKRVEFKIARPNFDELRESKNNKNEQSTTKRSLHIFFLFDFFRSNNKNADDHEIDIDQSNRELNSPFAFNHFEMATKQRMIVDPRPSSASSSSAVCRRNKHVGDNYSETCLCGPPFVARI